MDNKQIGIIAVAVVAILVVAGVGVAITSGNDKGKDGDYAGITLGCNLWVYGNVNGDDVIDQKDVDLLNKIVDGKESEVYINIYDGYNATGAETKVSLADANGDGKITADDVDKVKAIIAYQTKYAAAVKNGTLSTFAADEANKITVYYENCDVKKVSITLPIVNFGVVYYTNSEVVRLLGATDRVVLSDNTTINNHKNMLPEYQRADITNVGNTRFNLDSETLLKACDEKGMTALFTGSESTYSAGLESKVGTKISVIRLPAWEDNNFMAGTLTLGYLLGTTEKAYQYIDWAKGVIKSVEDALDGCDTTRIICAKGRTDSIMAGNGNGSGRSEITQWAGANNLVTSITPVYSEYPDIKSEWALSANPSAIVLSGNQGYEKNAETATTNMKEVYDAVVEKYAGTDAVTNKKIYILADDLFTGPAAIVGLVYIACYLHPDLTSSLDADAIFQQYVNNFGLGSSYVVKDHLAQFIYSGSA